MTIADLINRYRTRNAFVPQGPVNTLVSAQQARQNLLNLINTPHFQQLQQQMQGAPEAQPSFNPQVAQPAVQEFSRLHPAIQQMLLNSVQNPQTQVQFNPQLQIGRSARQMMMDPGMLTGMASQQ